MKLSYLLLLILHTSTATFDGLFRKRFPLRVVWFNETNCSGSSVHPGGPHHEPGKYSICVAPDVKVPRPQDTFDDPSKTRCTDEQQTTFPYTCSNYHGMYIVPGQPWLSQYRESASYQPLIAYRNGVPLPVPPVYLPDEDAKKPGNPFEYEILEIIPSPPHTARLRVVRGWKGTGRSDGMPYTNGRFYNQYSVIALGNENLVIDIVSTATRYGSGGPTSYFTSGVVNYPDGHRKTYVSEFGTDVPGLYSVNGTINHRYRTTNKAVTFPENVEYLGVGKPLRIGDTFELTPGVSDDKLKPLFYVNPYVTETFGPPGDRWLGMIFNVNTESEVDNDTIFLPAKVCEDGTVVHRGIPCSDDCPGMKQFYRGYCCPSTANMTYIGFEATIDEWCEFIQTNYEAKCRCKA